MSSLIRFPKYVNDSICSILPFRKVSLCLSLVAMTILLVFVSFIFILYISDDLHQIICKSDQCHSFSTNFHVSSRHECTISSRYLLKKFGDKQYPCLIPLPLPNSSGTNSIYFFFIMPVLRNSSKIIFVESQLPGSHFILYGEFIQTNCSVYVDKY